MGFTVTFHTYQYIFLNFISIIGFGYGHVCGYVHMGCPQRLGASDLKLQEAVSQPERMLGSSARTAAILLLSHRLVAQAVHCAVCPPLPPFAAVAADPLSLKQLPLPLPCQWLSLSPLFSLSRPLQNRFKYLIMDSGTTSPGVTSKALPHEACLSVSLAWLTNVLIWGPSVPYPSYARHHSLEPLRVLTRAGPQSGLEKTDFQILETSQGAEEPHLPPQVRLHSVPVPGWCT